MNEPMSFWPAALLASAIVLGAVGAVFLLWSLWDFARSLPRRHKAIRTLFVLTFSLLILGGLVFSAWLYSNKRFVAKELARIRAAGEPLEVSAGIAVTDTSGAAENYRRALQIIGSPTDEEHEVKLWEAYDNWLNGKSAAPPTEEQRKEARAVLDKARAGFERLDRAAELDPCVFSWRLSFGVSQLTSSLEEAMALAEYASFRTRVLTVDGDAEGALRSIRSMRRMMRIFERENLIVYLVGAAVKSLIAYDAIHLIDAGGLSQEQLSRLDEDMLALEDPAAFTNAMLTERAYALSLMGLTGSVIPAPEGSVYQKLGLSRYPYAADYLRAMRQVIDDSRQPVPPAQAKVPRGVAASVVPSMNRARLLASRSEVSLRSVRVAIMLHRYQQSKGSLPDSLEQLVPDFTDALPLDPLDGKPLKYKRDGDAVVIYGVDFNRTDDGGQIDADVDPLDWGVRVRLQ